jgi:hypothetical protein
MSRNGLRKGQEPEEGERIYIRSLTNKPGDIRIRTGDDIRNNNSRPDTRTQPDSNRKPDELDFEITPGGNDRTVDDNDREGYHLVKRGDTLYSISRKYKTTVEKLKRLNNIGNDAIHAGEWIKIK